MAGCQRNKLFSLGDQKWVWHNDESADAKLNHGRKSRLEVAFSAGGQDLQALLKSVGRGPNVRQVRLEVRISRISE